MTVYIQDDFDLHGHNTLAVPCVCAHFSEVSSQRELIDTIAWARSKEMPFYILGGGSNALLPKFIDGLVIHIKLKGINHRVSGDRVFVTAEAGENWHEFVCITLQNNWFGLENLSLIPGSVGASPIQNIGAYGVELSDRLYCVTVLNLETLTQQVLYKKDCEFSYRESIFKSSIGKRKYIVLSVCFELSVKANICIKYPALQQQISQDVKNNQDSLVSVSPKQVAKAVVFIRQSKLPAPQDIPNVGSFFKNPRLGVAVVEDLKKRFPDIPCYMEYPDESQVESLDSSQVIYKIPAAWLIDQAGWKGRFVDGVGVHDKQALVLINPNHESLSKVLGLAKLIQEDIHHRFGITLDVEPQALFGKI